MALQIAAGPPNDDALHIIEVELSLRRRLHVRYSYHHLETISRNRLIHTIGYLQHVLSDISWDGVRDGPCSFYMDTCDLAVRPGSIGYNRLLGDTQVRLIPDVYFYLETGYHDLRGEVPGWDERKRCFVWRGSTTGGANLDEQSIQHLLRYRLCSALLGRGAEVDAGFTAVVQARSERDAAALRARLAADGLWREPMDWAGFCRSKFLIDMDGNAGSWSFLKKLLTGSCVIRVESNYEQWFDHDLTPWLHYVPVKRDLSDLDEVVSWCLRNDDACRRIGEAGRAFALERDFASQMALAAATIMAVAMPVA